MTVKIHLAILLGVTGLFLTSFSHPARACGFWGDGDVGMISNDSDVDTEGRYLSQADPLVARGVVETRLPEGRGFSFALKEPTQPIPYKLAIKEDSFLSIGELRAFGIVSAIDLVPSASAIPHHREETLASGIRYFSIPVDSFPPHADQVRQFSKIVSNPANFPIIVYAENSEILASLWSAYRYLSGIEQRQAVAEGKRLGLHYQFEEELHWHLRNGKLASLRPVNPAR